MRKVDYYKVKTYTVENTFHTDLIMPAQEYDNLRVEIDQGKSNTRIYSVEPYFPKNGMTGCKILAVELRFHNGVPTLTSGYASIVKDSDTQFKVETSRDLGSVEYALINCRQIIKKSEVNKIWFDENEMYRNMQRCTDMDLKAWVLVDKENDVVEIHWKHLVKNAAVTEAQSRLRKASLMLKKIDNMEVKVSGWE